MRTTISRNTPSSAGIPGFVRGALAAAAAGAGPKGNYEVAGFCTSRLLSEDDLSNRAFARLERIVENPNPGGDMFQDHACQASFPAKILAFMQEQFPQILEFVPTPQRHLFAEGIIRGLASDQSDVPSALAQRYMDTQAEFGAEEYNLAMAEDESEDDDGSDTDESEDDDGFSHSRTL